MFSSFIDSMVVHLFSTWFSFVWLKLIFINDLFSLHSKLKFASLLYFSPSSYRFYLISAASNSAKVSRTSDNFRDAVVAGLSNDIETNITYREFSLQLNVFSKWIYQNKINGKVFENCRWFIPHEKEQPIPAMKFMKIQIHRRNWQINHREDIHLFIHKCYCLSSNLIGLNEMAFFFVLVIHFATLTVH